MLKIEHTEVAGWEAAIRGMRNAMNSWEKSDSVYTSQGDNTGTDCPCDCPLPVPFIGDNDHDLMMRLNAGGSVHAKYRRMIIVWVDITAPLYWWKEFDTYKVGTVANSCSTMHKIHAKEFTLDDFSYEHLHNKNLEALAILVDGLNEDREYFMDGKDKDDWWQMIQMLPTSYNQRRTVMMSYEVLVGMYRDRKNHKLDEWHTLCDWIRSLPYSEIITGEGV